MIFLKPGSHIFMMFSVLSVTGEFPFRSLHLLGSQKVMQVLVRKLADVQTICNPMTEEKVTAATVQILGKRSLRTIRLTEDAAPILRWLEAEEDYEKAFPGDKLPNDNHHRERNHRVAEAVALCAVSGIEYRPHLLPRLQVTQRIMQPMDIPAFYLSRALKQAGNQETNKTAFSRVVGALLLGGVGYAVYNTRDAEMRWIGLGEQKALYRLQSVLGLNFPCPQIDSAVLFGASEEKAFSAICSSGQSVSRPSRLDSIYWHIHFVPSNDYGKRFLKIMALPDWKERLLELAFADETRTFGRGTFEYDAIVNDVYFLSHLDCDVARLYRFRDAAQSYTGTFRVLCYSHQEAFLQGFLGPGIEIKAIPMETVENLLFSDQEGEA